ncbi:MAG TPA: S8 family serine peptidase [Polyangiaceae bacterium]|nr:S8 family serine peptidase [Polyangiaceae bacterium]
MSTRPMRTPARLLFALAFGGIGAACGNPDPGPIVFPPPPPPVPPRPSDTPGRKVTVPVTCPTKPVDSSRTRVMVVDSGFDPRHPIFEGKIAGCYRIDCPTFPSFSYPRGESDDDTAARLVAYLQEPEPACTLTEGFDIEVDPYLEYMDPKLRDTWNGALLGKRELSAEWPVSSILRATANAAYHGTATAGAVAYQNDVDIVAVQIKLGLPGEPSGDPVPCPKQTDIDRHTRLLSRTDVSEAYVSSPLDGEEQILIALRQQQGIRIENHSYGVPTTKERQSKLFCAGCGFVSLAEDARVQGELEAARLANLTARGVFDGTDVVILQSGGNDGDPIDDVGDDFDCVPGQLHHLLVGSYEIYREQAVRSGFSNFGNCVDAYALGESVILPSAAGFYGVVSGTSFSSPLATRYASLLAGESPTAATLREKVLSVIDEHRFLPLGLMPRELSYHSSTTADAGAHQTSLAPLRVDRPRRAAPIHGMF